MLKNIKLDRRAAVDNIIIKVILIVIVALMAFYFFSSQISNFKTILGL